MKKLLTTFITCCLVAISLSAQTKSGILLGGGIWGGVNTKLLVNPYYAIDFGQEGVLMYENHLIP